MPRPDLSGVRQWGPGNYSDLKQEYGSDSKPPRGFKQLRQVEEEKKGNIRIATFCVSLPPSMAMEIRRKYGKGKLSRGIRGLFNLVELAGPDHISSTTQSLADAYATLALRLSCLEKGIPAPPINPDADYEYPTHQLPGVRGKRKSKSTKLQIKFPKKPLP